MKKVVISSIAVVSVVISVEASPLANFTGFVGFGDSLSDIGRQPDQGVPYDGGRFSNGPTWMEIIGNEFEMRVLPNINLALGGATAGDVNLNDPGYQALDAFITPNPSLPDQLPFFDLGTFDRQIATFDNRGFDDQVGDNPLVGVLFGGNDFLQNLGDPLFDPTGVAADVVDGVRALAQLDPKFDDFLVLNMPDLAPTPALAGLSDAEKALVTGAVFAFNGALSSELSQLETDEGISVELFDLFAANSLLAQELGANGVDLTTPCVAGGVSICASIEEADGFFFIDGVHPNRAVHAGIAAGVQPFVQSNLAPVPLPAGMPLLLAGMGIFGAARLMGRKKAA